MWKDVCRTCGRQIWNGVPKEVSEKEVPEQQAPTPPAVSEAPITEITPEEILKIHKESLKE